MMTDNITVLMIDDHELIRSGLGAVIDLQPDMQVVGTAGTVPEAIAAYRTLAADVVVADLQLQDGTGLDIVRTIRKNSDADRAGRAHHALRRRPDLRRDAGRRLRLRRQGRAGHRGHQGRPPRSGLAEGVRVCRTGRRDDAAPLRRDDVAHRARARRAPAAGRGPQRGRDRRPKLYLSESTTKSHIARIYQKLGAANRAQALVTAMRIGLLSTVQP